MRDIDFRLVGLIVAIAMMGPPSLLAGERSSVTFERDVQPVLTRAGCNAGACHGKARGQNGFALSLFGFDPDHDYVAIVKESGGRRVSRVIATESLILSKATARLPHGGGLRLTPGSTAYETVLRWIASGMPRTPSDAPRLKRIAAEPTERTLKRSESFPIRVTAHFSDGSEEDVTKLAAFASSESALVGVERRWQGHCRADPRRRDHLGAVWRPFCELRRQYSPAGLGRCLAVQCPAPIELHRRPGLDQAPQTRLAALRPGR